MAKERKGTDEPSREGAVLATKLLFLLVLKAVDSDFQLNDNDQILLSRTYNTLLKHAENGSEFLFATQEVFAAMRKLECLKKQERDQGDSIYGRLLEIKEAVRELEAKGCYDA
jgi:hypothetical protein